MTPTAASGTGAQRPRRRYDSTVRREQARKTRARIVDAGADLVHSFSSWDWRGLTVRAVAERAGVNERTVYRHFSTEAHLREAVIAQLEQEAGIRPEAVTVAELGDHVTALFRYLSTFSSSSEPSVDAALQAEDQRRKAGLQGAVTVAAPGWTDEERAAAAALIDILTGVAAYRRLVSGWQFDASQAAAAASWALSLIAREIETGRPPRVT